MSSFPRLSPATVAVFAALLLGLAPRPTRASDPERSVQAADADGPTAQFAELGDLIARDILSATSPEDLSARLDAQVETGQFTSWVQLSLHAMQHDAPPELRRLQAGELSLDDLLDEFVFRASSTNQVEVREALRLSLLSGQLGSRLWQQAMEDFDEDTLDVKIAEAANLLFYDVSIPLEVRRALYEGMESALCMTSIAHAVGQDIELSPWLARALVDRWLNGQRASLRLFFPLAREQGIEILDLEPAPGIEELDLTVLQAQANRIVEANSIIIQYGAEQPTGSWPPTEPTPTE